MTAWYSRLLIKSSLLVSIRSRRLGFCPCLYLVGWVTCWYKYASLIVSVKCWLLWFTLFYVVTDSQSISGWLKSPMITTSTAFWVDRLVRMVCSFASSSGVLEGLRYIRYTHQILWNYPYQWFYTQNGRNCVSSQI